MVVMEEEEVILFFFPTRTYGLFFILNFKNIENMWPIMITRDNRHSIEFTAPLIFKTNIGRNPLIRSKKNVRKPAILFPLLITFVAPGLLEPNDLGSGKEKIFEITTANGIDPII